MLKNYDFIKNKKIAYIILAAVIVIGIASFFVRGFVIDIDFSGGSELQVNLGTEVTDEICDKIDDVITNSIGHEYVSSTLPSTADNNVVIIRTGTNPLTLEQQTTLKSELKKVFQDINLDDLQFNTISATIGEDLKNTAIVSVLVSLVFIVVYIWIRFELVSGIACFICMLHDLFVMMMFYSLLQIPLNSNIIATLLTIVGYSLNATIIVFDRVRENRKMLGDAMSFADTVNLSIHQTLTRSISTTTTTLITAVAVYIFGVDSIRNFALPLIIGIVAGLFSSIFLAGVFWVEGNKIFKPKDKKAKQVKVAKTAKNTK
jgi:preprotein translocase subunit SecF